MLSYVRVVWLTVEREFYGMAPQMPTGSTSVPASPLSGVSPGRASTRLGRDRFARDLTVRLTRPAVPSGEGSTPVPPIMATDASAAALAASRDAAAPYSRSNPGAPNSPVIPARHPLHA
jgi:hypothetical protein